MKSIFLKITLLLATFFAFTSCDKDFNSLDSDLADDTHFNLEKYEVEAVYKHHCRFLAKCIKESKAFIFPSVGIYKPYNKKPKTPLEDEPTS